MVLPLDVARLRVTIYFLGDISTVKEAFWGRFFGREILRVGTQLSMKAPVCGGDFPSQVIWRSIIITSNRWSRMGYCTRIEHNTEKRDKIFRWNLLIGKNYGEGEELHYNSQITNIIGRRWVPRGCRDVLRFRNPEVLEVSEEVLSLLEDEVYLYTTELLVRERSL